MKTLAEQHVKPHFTFSGGVWYCFREFDVNDWNPNYLPARHAKFFFDTASVKKMVESYHWWKKRDPKSARITDAMLIRNASAYRLWDLNGRKRFEMVGGSSLFTSNLASIHSVDYFKYVGRRLKNVKGGKSRISLDMIPTLIASGYCRTSNRSLTVSRIDREDWRDVLAVHLAPHDPMGDGLSRASASGMGDYYRRNYSKDHLTITDPAMFKLFPGSGDGPNIFIPLCRGEKGTTS